MMDGCSPQEYNQVMSKWLAGTDLVQGIARDLLQPRQEYYSDEAFRYRLIEHVHLAQRMLPVKNRKGEPLHTLLFDRREKQSEYCIVFMHGLASNTLQAVSILDHLLPNTALCVFDFAGSGRSGGNICTYGLKEHEDVVAVLDRLQVEGYRQFVLWGRSMGAVACLLHGFNFGEERVVLQVADSPFCSFESVCELYAKRFMGIPQLLVGPALSLLKDSFASHQYNPFRLDLLPLAEKCRTPTLFLYNQQDEVIPASNAEQLIKNLHPNCYYERVAIPDPHNHVRSPRTTALVFEKVKKLMKGIEGGRMGRRRGFDVMSSLLKREQTSREERQVKAGKEGFRRSAIYCSLSKKSSCYLTPKGENKRENPQHALFDTNF